jgi:hypothetical protein
VELVDELGCADEPAAVDCATDLLSDVPGVGVLVGGALTLLAGVVDGGLLALLDGVLDDGVLVGGDGVLVGGGSVGGRPSTQLTDSSPDSTTEPSTPITRTSYDVRFEAGALRATLPWPGPSNRTSRPFVGAISWPSSDRTSSTV